MHHRSAPRWGFERVWGKLWGSPQATRAGTVLSGPVRAAGIRLRPRQGGPDLDAGVDTELPERPCKLRLDRFLRHEERLRDLAIGHAFRNELGRPALAGRERRCSARGHPARPRTRGNELVGSLALEDGRAALLRELPRPLENGARLCRRPALAQRATVIDQRAGQLEPGRRALEAPQGLEAQVRVVADPRRD